MGWRERVAVFVVWWVVIVCGYTWCLWFVYVVLILACVVWVCLWLFNLGFVCGV